MGVDLDGHRVAFLRRVERASLVMTALIGLFGWTYLGGRWALSFVLAAVWMTANLWALERLGVAWMLTGNRKALAAFFCLKVPVLYGLLLAYLIALPWLPSALVGGISLPLAVIVLKALGQLLVQAMGNEQVPPAGRLRNEGEKHGNHE